MYGPIRPADVYTTGSILLTRLSAAHPKNVHAYYRNLSRANSVYLDTFLSEHRHAVG